MKLITLQDTYLKQGTRQSSDYPAGEKLFLKSGTVLPVVAVTQVGNHYKFTLGKDSDGNQLSFLGFNTWYGYIPHIQAELGLIRPDIATSNTRVNPAGVELIKYYEGLRLSAYQCSAGVWTIGYGTTSGVYEGQRISAEEAERLLKKDLNKFSLDVEDLVTVPLNSNQFSALVSFVYNLGEGALRTSTLLRKLNSGDYAGAADEFPRWNKAVVNGQMTVLEGLTRRRAAERKLFLKPA